MVNDLGGNPPARRFEDRACFIAGSAKSGTTLLVSLLDGHSGLLVFPEETAYFPTVRRKYHHAGRGAQVRYLIEQAESRLLFAPKALAGNRDYSDFPRERFRRDFEERANRSENSDRNLLTILAASYARMIEKPPEDVQCWIEKTPANRYCLPDIRSCFPRAKILLMMRDPRAILAAYLQRRRKKGGTLSFYSCVSNWRQSADVALQAGSKTADWLKVVRFENLLHNPEAEMRSVCDFLGVDFHPGQLVPTKIGKAWRGNSGGKDRFQEIDATPAERWRSVLSAKELGWVEMHCRGWMTALGYAPLTSSDSLRHWLRKYGEESWGGYLTDRRRSLRDRVAGRWEVPQVCGNAC